jgi:hypothetical protein
VATNPLYARWLQDPPCWTAGYDDGARVERIDAPGIGGTVVGAVHLGMDLVVQVHWDGIDYATDAVDACSCTALRLIAPACPTPSAVPVSAAPVQLAIGDLT